MSFLLKRLNLNIPLIGVYDAPEDTGFGDIVTPPQAKHSCFFAFYKKWLNGSTLKLGKDNFGCGGCGTWMFGETTRSRQEYIEFLADDEGLKADHERMGAWFDHMQAYRPEHGFLFIGPLDERFKDHLRSVSFFVNPDQLSALMIGAQYFHRTGEAEPVIAPFGSGCMLMLTHFSNLETPQAMIGGTDMAMRKYLPKDLLIFTVTVPMYEQLNSIGKDSFLDKRFLADLKKARKGSL